MSNPPQPTKRHGCFFYGCLTTVVLGLIGAIVVVLFVANLPKLLNRMAVGYTDSAPTQLERVEVSPAELKILQERVATFQQALQDGKTSQELVLTAHDINALIGNDPALKELKDKLVVSIETNTIKGQVSWPLEDLGPLKLKGRYLNGEVAFRVSLEAGRLGVFITDVKVKGQPLPGLLTGKFTEQNLAEEVQKDRKSAAQIEKFDSIKIEDGKITVRNKAKP